MEIAIWWCVLISCNQTEIWARPSFATHRIKVAIIRWDLILWTSCETHKNKECLCASNVKGMALDDSQSQHGVVELVAIRKSLIFCVTLAGYWKSWFQFNYKLSEHLIHIGELNSGAVFMKWCEIGVIPLWVHGTHIHVRLANTSGECICPNCVRCQRIGMPFLHQIMALTSLFAHMHTHTRVLSPRKP